MLSRSHARRGNAVTTRLRHETLARLALGYHAARGNQLV
jgi:hypothetical protein